MLHDFFAQRKQRVQRPAMLFSNQALGNESLMLVRIGYYEGGEECAKEKFQRNQ